MDIKNFTGSLSKKLTLTAGSTLFIVLTEVFKIDVSLEKMLSLTGIVISYLIGQSFIDVKKEGKK